VRFAILGGVKRSLSFIEDEYVLGWDERATSGIPFDIVLDTANECATVADSTHFVLQYLH